MKQINIAQALSENIPIVDVRSEGEYSIAHIPNASNIPLMNNHERKLVGTEYRKKGNSAALKLGHYLVGPRFLDIKKHLKLVSKNNRLIIHCWRGGKRSEIIYKLAEEAKLEPLRIEGGYRSYRNWCREVLCIKRNLFVLSGKTGAGKTDLLQMLRNSSIQIFDLEKLANHKGSVFGGLGKESQPTQEMFENLLANHWHKLENQPVFVENESRMIGKLFIPEPFFIRLKQHDVLHVELPLKVRKERIIEEYGSFSKLNILTCALKLKKRLGGLRLKNIEKSLEVGSYEWVDVLLDYYDKGYDYHKEKYNQRIIRNFHGNDLQQIHDQIIEWLNEKNYPK
ncbi:tRNA 2-selenouridine(34) synthase MnmH [Candidatus Uabimicrobium sp. HlEnr_7]|uniref:tRNA 2-selenouridine(34) synthase MnmH n=1 Tax=Candidatus Uabimicrobium helgolandensis TaxID=3095367 RepID=UPI003555FB5B